MRIAKQINLSEYQKRILEKFSRGTHTPQHIAERSKIVLLANEGYRNEEIIKELHMTNTTVILWRTRYHNAQESLIKVEKDSPNKLKEEIIKVFTDIRRSGAPSHFTDVQIAEIIALSLQDPQSIGYPFSNWSIELLKNAVIEKKIVDSISKSQIRRFLKRERY